MVPELMKNVLLRLLASDCFPHGGQAAPSHTDGRSAAQRIVAPPSKSVTDAATCYNRTYDILGLYDICMESKLLRRPHIGAADSSPFRAPRLLFGDKRAATAQAPFQRAALAACREELARQNLLRAELRDLFSEISAQPRRRPSSSMRHRPRRTAYSLQQASCDAISEVLLRSNLALWTKVVPKNVFGVRK